MKKTLFRFMIVAVMSATLFSCKDDDPIDNNPPSTQDNGRVYILNEGVWGGNDAELSRFSPTDNSIINDYFASKNGRGLGDVGNDIEIYGGKMYVVVNTSNTVEVLNPKTGNSIQQIPLNGKGPREVAFCEGYAYVSCYDKTVVKIDTTSLSIVAQCQTEGGKCEDLYAYNGYLYVTHAWDQTATGSTYYDSTMSVINLSTFTVEDKITIGLNPKQVKPIGQGRIMVVCNGNYADVSSYLSVLDMNTKTIQKVDIPASNFAVYNDVYALAYNYDWTTGQQAFTKIDLNTFSETTWSYDGGKSLVSPYGIAIDPQTQNTYITDAQNYQTNGDVYVFDAQGTFISKHECGVGPSKIVFL